MKVSRIVPALIVTFVSLTMLTNTNVAAPQGPTSVDETVKGRGTLTVGKEVFKINTVVVKLKEDGTGQLILVTDLALFVLCNWSVNADPAKGIDLKITGGTNAGSAEGSGKILLKGDGKTVGRLSLQGNSTAVKRKIQVTFVAE